MADSSVLCRELCRGSRRVNHRRQTSLGVVSTRCLTAKQLSLSRLQAAVDCLLSALNVIKVS